MSLRANRSTRPQLGLEFLEGRIVPAVVVTQLDLDGDGATDDIRIGYTASSLAKLIAMGGRSPSRLCPTALSWTATKLHPSST